ncbi:MAG: glycosyltransferase [Desulfobacteraceae bacterium]
MLLNLVEEQVFRGLLPVIASIGEKNISEKPFETEALKRGLSLIKFRMLPGPNISGAIDLLKYAQSNGFHVIHSHGYKGNILLGFIPRVIRRLPMIATLHGYTSTSGLTKMRLYEWLDTMSHRFIDSVVLVNKGMLKHPKLNKQKRIKFHIINNGITISNRTEKSEKTQNEIFTIGSIGRFSTEKGYNYLIESFNLLLKKGVDSRLILIGEGHERGRLEQLIKHYKLEDKVELTGYRENARKYIPDFDVYAISSLTEGLPITLLEAMQARTPVVATSVGGIPEVIQHLEEGLLVDPCDPAAMAEAFLLLNNDPLYSKELADKAYNKMVKTYSSRTMANKYLTLYSDVINKRTKIYQV